MLGTYLVFCNGPKDAPHDLARARLGQVADLNDVRHREWADAAADGKLEFLEQIGALCEPVLQRDVGVDAGALDLVREANDGRLGYSGVLNERTLNLGGAQAVSSHIDDVIDSPGDPYVPVLFVSYVLLDASAPPAD